MDGDQRPRWKPHFLRKIGINFGVLISIFMIDFPSRQLC